MLDVVRPNDRREPIREAACYLVSVRKASTRLGGRLTQIVDARQRLRTTLAVIRELFVGVVDRQFCIAGQTAQEQR
jgi:hypothetical protein